MLKISLTYCKCFNHCLLCENSNADEKYYSPLNTWNEKICLYIMLMFFIVYFGTNEISYS